ncbi:MAG: ATP-binding protein [Oleiphilaceae bacterium]|nr:ATP-binding protein [Oleiphilaceae bacterium]
MLSLRRQLGIVLLLTLMIPAAGLYFVLDLESALREQQEQQLLSRARVLSRHLARDPALMSLPPMAEAPPVLYAQPLERPLFLDGYGDDWPGASGSSGRPPMHDAGDGVRWNAAEDGQYLYLLIRVQQPSVRYYAPQSPRQPHDSVRLYQRHGLQEAGAPRLSHRIRTSAPGPIQALANNGNGEGRDDPRVQGVWQEFPGGYSLELRLPYPATLSHLGFQVLTPGKAGGQDSTVRGNLGPQPSGLPRLRTRDSRLSQTLATMTEPGLTVRALDAHGWTLGEATALTPPREDLWQSGPMAIAQRLAFNGLRALLAWREPPAMALSMTAGQLSSPLRQQVLEQGQAQLAVTRGSGGGRSLTALAPVSDRALLMLEQDSRTLVSLSGATLGQVLSRSLLLVVALALALVGYAGWLSWRISRLRRAVAATVDPQGRLVGTLTPGPRRDELDDLAHHFAHLLERLQGYTGYLESFARKLSHEIKTPLAVVRSSLDNLGHTGLSLQQDTYHQRALQGADRLRHILNAMSEASRLERSIESAEPERFDLAPVLSQTMAAYQDLDPDHVIEYRGPRQGCPALGVPELLVQMLDKLVDNARDFTPAGGRITLRLTPGSRDYRLDLSNTGSRLPADSSDLFASFVSLRDEPGGHLGQGLLMVRLIARLHGGHIRAYNLPRGEGVCFTLNLPYPGKG